MASLDTMMLRFGSARLRRRGTVGRRGPTSARTWRRRVARATSRAEHAVAVIGLVTAWEDLAERAQPQQRAAYEQAARIGRLIAHADDPTTAIRHDDSLSPEVYDLLQRLAAEPDIGVRAGTISSLAHALACAELVEPAAAEHLDELAAAYLAAAARAR